MQTQRACQFILDTLTTHLSPKLTYHNIQHTYDVVEQTNRIARAEGIQDNELLDLMRTAAYYHDAGFLYVYSDHEEESCRIAIQQLPTFGYTPAQIAQVCQLIRATRLPSAPTTLPEAILCDADLDYLGRADYPSISQLLLAEWLAFGFQVDSSQWLSIQRSFLTNHSYFTNTNQKLREFRKQQTLSLLNLESLDCAGTTEYP